MVMPMVLSMSSTLLGPGRDGQLWLFFFFFEGVTRYTHYSTIGIWSRLLLGPFARGSREMASKKWKCACPSPIMMVVGRVCGVVNIC